MSARKAPSVELIIAVQLMAQRMCKTESAITFRLATMTGLNYEDDPKYQRLRRRARYQDAAHTRLVYALVGWSS